MELEAIRQRKQQLEAEINNKTEEINGLKLEKSTLETKAESKRAEISEREESILNKREELKKLSIAIEVLER